MLECTLERHKFVTIREVVSKLVDKVDWPQVRVQLCETSDATAACSHDETCIDKICDGGSDFTDQPRICEALVVTTRRTSEDLVQNSLGLVAGRRHVRQGLLPGLKGYVVGEPQNGPHQVNLLDQSIGKKKWRRHVARSFMPTRFDAKRLVVLVLTQRNELLSDCGKVPISKIKPEATSLVRKYPAASPSELHERQDVPLREKNFVQPRQCHGVTGLSV
jgi:hypothetical protein